MELHRLYALHQPIVLQSYVLDCSYTPRCSYLSSPSPLLLFPPVLPPTLKVTLLFPPLNSHVGKLVNGDNPHGVECVERRHFIRASATGNLQSRRKEQICLPKKAPSMTAKMLIRLHNIVHTSPNGCSWSKQTCLAIVVAIFTGVPLKSKDEAEYIGNAQDAYLRHHCQALKKAKQAKSTAARKARKAGRKLPSSSHHDERIAELEERV